MVCLCTSSLIEGVILQPASGGLWPHPLNQVGLPLHLLPIVEWANWKGIEFALNNHANRSSGESPFFTVYGCHPSVPFPVPISSVVPSAAERQQSFNSIWADVFKNLHLAASRYIGFQCCLSPIFLPGDKIWYIHLYTPSMKFAPHFIGPFTILCQVKPVAFKLRLPLHLWGVLKSSKFLSWDIKRHLLYKMDRFFLSSSSSFSNSQYHGSVWNQANPGFQILQGGSFYI